MTSYPAVRALLLALGVISLLFLCTCEPEQEAPRQYLPQVTVAPVRQQTVPAYLDFVGNLKAVQEVEIRARVEGYLTKRAFQDGADVNRGDLLFVIQPQEYQAELERAQAQLAKDRAALSYARSQVRRYTPLVKQDLAPEDTLDNWRTTVQEREGAVKADLAAIKLARLNLSYSTIRAPISGRIGRRLVDVGNLVGADEETLLATIVQMDPIYVYFNPSERLLPRIFSQNRSGPLQVKLTLSGGSDYPHLGKVDFIDNRVDPQTATITVRAVVPNPDKILIPGQYANVRLLLGENPDALLVPERAVGTDQRGSYVFVLGPDNKVEQRYVQIGALYPGKLLLIESGLKPGEKIVVEGLQRLRPGIEVEVKGAGGSKGNAGANSGK
ncbi:MAG: efflux RND transporter periplasmic adaptor subunit [Thermodesulfobacteriota bacterium]